MRALCEQMVHLPGRRSTHNFVMLTSCVALFLSLLLWLNVRAGCSEAALSLAAESASNDLLEQEIRDQHTRLRDLEVMLLDEHSEKQKAGARAQIG